MTKMSLNADSAAKLVEALDKELCRRWNRRRVSVEAAARAEYVDQYLPAAQAALERARVAVEAAQAAVDEAEEEEAGPAEARLAAAETALEASQQRLAAAERSAQVWQGVCAFARMLEWHADNPAPVRVVTESDEPSLDPVEFFVGLRDICRKAEMLLEHEEDLASGAPRRRAVIIGPRIRMPYGESRPASGKGRDSEKHTKKSRTEIWAEKQTEEAMARQALLPPRLAQAALQQTELGWHLGEIISFDQIRKTGTVKFVGMVGISEAEISPDVAIRSGHANFFRGERVDCRLVRRLDGSVGINAIKMAVGADPRGSAAAEAEQRIRIQLDRRWLN